MKILMEEAGTPADAGASTLLGSEPTPAPDTTAATETNVTDTPAATQTPNTLLGAAGTTGEDVTDKTAEVKPGEDKSLDEIKGLDTMTYAEGELDELKALCKDNGISAKTANAILAWQDKYAQRTDEAIAKRVNGEIQEYIKAEAARNIDLVHKEWGADKATIAQNEADVARVVNQFADADFKKLMNESGIGNNPAMVRFVLKIGRAIANDRFIGGNRGGGATDVAHRMFPGYEK